MTPPDHRGGAGGDEFLRELILAQGGSISVERFMREALYHPRHGYYAGQVRTVGREGDFSTSATLHPALARAVSSWAAAHRDEVASRGTWHLIELGGGTGAMAAEILRSMSWWSRRGLRYHLVDISEGLRRTQRERLQHAGGVVRWHENLASALAEAGGRALVFSNEFVDAFPCVQLVRRPEPGEWQEVRVAWPEGADQPVETFAGWPGRTPDLGPSVEPAVGQRVEMHETHRDWLEAGVREWTCGRLLTIDYGDMPPALYHRRPQGTLRGYCRHQRITGLEIYRRFGRQDLTADVNFADLRGWGEALGLGFVSLTTQSEFLRRRLSRRTLARADRDAALAFLLDPDGAGGAFKVLEQRVLARPANQKEA